MVHTQVCELTIKASDTCDSSSVNHSDLTLSHLILHYIINYETSIYINSVFSRNIKKQTLSLTDSETILLLSELDRDHGYPEAAYFLAFIGAAN